MGKPKTLLEEYLRHARLHGADSIGGGIQRPPGMGLRRQIGGAGRVNRSGFPSSSADAEELRENLYAAARSRSAP